MDITVLSAIINIIWYIGTSLFLLFKFTSLFSYAINFSKFCWRLLTSTKYLFNLVFYKKKYTLVQTDENDIEHHNENTSFFSKIKTSIKKIYYKTYHYIFNKHHPNSIRSQPLSTPLTTYETADSSMYINNSHNSAENQMFYQQLDNLNNSEYATQVTDNTNYFHRNYQNSYYNTNQSLYHPNYNNTNYNYSHSNTNYNHSNTNYNHSNTNYNHSNTDNMDRSYLNQSLYHPNYNNTNMDNNIDSDIKININLENENENENENDPKNIFNIQDSNELFKSHFISNNLNNNHFTNPMPFAVYTQPSINENENLSNSTHSIYKDPLLYQYEQDSEKSSEEDIPLLHDKNYV
uniref:Uncharacterized protein n=1 Tax=viral metagenome TaxID=1070528 RepID=A0A6C0DVK1_9ZZZZ